MVTTLSLLATVAVALAAEAVRAGGVARRAARVATVVSVLVAVLSVAGLVSSGYADPVPPIVILPGALVLGIAVVAARRPAEERVAAARRGS